MIQGGEGGLPQLQAAGEVGDAFAVAEGAEELHRALGELAGGGEVAEDGALAGDGLAGRCPSVPTYARPRRRAPDPR